MTVDERSQIQTKARSTDRSWRFWWTLPIYPYGDRQTMRTEVVPETIWTFEQLQGILHVIVPIRMTVVRLAGGGLFVYAPVAPTAECLQLLDELVVLYGNVKYIILPTISGLEHKVFVSPFARAFPQAQVWVTPDQWSFPLNLPLSWLGLPRDRTHVLPANSRDTPFGDCLDYAILETIDLGPGQFAEVAFFHRQSRTLLVTDSIVSLPIVPPPIVQAAPYSLLFHARERSSDPIVDTSANRLKGWQRICLFTLYFQPSVLKVRTWRQTWQESLTAPARTRHNYFGLYPFDWQSQWQQRFADLRGDGKLLVAPILQTSILNRAPQSTLAWVDRVAQWNFEQIVPCHFDAPVAATPTQFRAAFDFLAPDAPPDLIPATDMQLLRQIDRQLTWWRIIYPAQKL